ncbi:MAG: NADH-quinone oxidoreductase subunit NuoE [Ignavibacteriaceae bacterium]|nr:NADH-quinone oxidoreductase subunit NuoE [Ignavibacteriaceae bacterium]
MNPEIDIRTAESEEKEPTAIRGFKYDLIRKRNQNGSLILLLQSAQESYGYIPEKAICYISELLSIPAADIYGVITFYSQFRLKPMGKNLIRVCEGTACHVNNAKALLECFRDELGISVGETSDDGLFSLQSVACLGCCSLAPVIMINDETHGNLDKTKLKKLLKAVREKELCACKRKEGAAAQ